MRKISKQSTAFIDHRRKGDSLWLKKLKKKTLVIKFKKRVLGLTEIKIQKLVSKNKKTPAGKESFSNILGESNQLCK